MLDFTKIIFVSKTDTGRGPLACEIMKKMLGSYAGIESRGLVVLFPEPMNPKMVAIAASKGINLEDRVSVQLTEEDFDSKTLVLTMDEKYKTVIYDDYTNAVNVYTVKEFVGDDGDLENPYGGELMDYGRVYENLEELTQKVIERLREEDSE
ncbi:phosphotyrosine protein phosphatase [uncultured Eubacterium sp.]|uniref:arsenate reductase/protein-tyrosine-phosphatase family protein n=1 Tax=uncultured Eubacterium sp. TaxID=165185 RepID=UPI000ECE3796|nr:phosphotyrosine protein phosphatase [uncultured Eubacterium sp.]HAH18967.1 phosphotyrosine protein phosphatase [Eubacterium sp.]